MPPVFARPPVVTDIVAHNDDTRRKKMAGHEHKAIMAINPGPPATLTPELKA